jgi:hypothetical protein
MKENQADEHHLPDDRRELADAPELRFTPYGTASTRMRAACNERQQNEAGGGSTSPLAGAP